jgi:hypothetical protein
LRTACGIRGAWKNKSRKGGCAGRASADPAIKIIGTTASDNSP